MDSSSLHSALNQRERGTYLKKNLYTQLFEDHHWNYAVNFIKETFFTGDFSQNQVNRKAIRNCKAKQDFIITRDSRSQVVFHKFSHPRFSLVLNTQQEIVYQFVLTGDHLFLVISDRSFLHFYKLQLQQLRQGRTNRSILFVNNLIPVPKQVYIDPKFLCVAFQIPSANMVLSLESQQTLFNDRSLFFWYSQFHVVQAEGERNISQIKVTNLHTLQSLRHPLPQISKIQNIFLSGEQVLVIDRNQEIYIINLEKKVTRFVPNHHFNKIWEPDFFDGLVLVGREQVTKLGSPVQTLRLSSLNPVFADVSDILIVYENSSQMIHFIGENGEFLVSRRIEVPGSVECLAIHDSSLDLYFGLSSGEICVFR